MPATKSRNPYKKPKKPAANMPYSSKTLDTQLTQTELRIRCTTPGCKWKRKPMNYEADRVAGRRHAEQEGHIVVAKVTREITWDGS